MSKPPSRMRKEQLLVDQLRGARQAPERYRPEEVEAARREVAGEVRYQEEEERSPKRKGVSDSNSSAYRPRQSEGNLSAMAGWHGMIET